MLQCSCSSFKLSKCIFVLLTIVLIDINSNLISKVLNSVRLARKGPSCCEINLLVLYYRCCWCYQRLCHKAFYWLTWISSNFQRTLKEPRIDCIALILSFILECINTCVLGWWHHHVIARKECSFSSDHKQFV